MFELTVLAFRSSHLMFAEKKALISNVHLPYKTSKRDVNLLFFYFIIFFALQKGQATLK